MSTEDKSSTTLVMTKVSGAHLRIVRFGEFVIDAVLLGADPNALYASALSCVRALRTEYESAKSDKAET